MSRLTLFGLPFAGGNAYSYRPLAEHMSAEINFVPLELPGRGRRVGEPLLEDIAALADDVLAQIGPQLEAPYALYGHSMGANLVYLLAHRIEQLDSPRPLHLFVSGCAAPSISPKPEHQQRHRLPRGAFVHMLRQLGGCPPEILANDQLMEFFEPIIRADFTANACFEPPARPPLEIPITALSGSADEVSLSAVEAWAEETRGPFSVHAFPGDHFFIFAHAALISALFAREMAVHLST